MALTDKLVLVCSSLCLAAMLVVVSNPAHACSTPAHGWNSWGALTFDDPVPTDGVVAFELSLYGPDDGEGLLSVDVRDAQDTAVDGSLSLVLLHEGLDGPPGSEDRYLVSWKPASPLSAQATYEISIQGEHLYTDSLTLDEQTTFETTSGPAAQLPSSAIEISSASISEQRGGFECCTRQAFCDSCDLCDRCWATRYDYLPTVEAELSLPHSSALATQVYTEVRSDGKIIDVIWDSNSPTRTLAANFDEGAAGPFCLEIATISLLTGEEIGFEERCFDQDDLPAYTERELTGEGPPPECESDAGSSDAGSSDAGSSDAGSSDTGSTDTGQTDGGASDAARADTGSSGGANNDSGGCSSAAPASPVMPSTVAIVCALVGLGVLRRR